MSFRCDCCNIALPSKSKPNIRPLELGSTVKEVIVGGHTDSRGKFHPTYERRTVPILTQENLCNVCDTGLQAGIPRIRLKQMGGKSTRNFRREAAIKGRPLAAQVQAAAKRPKVKKPGRSRTQPHHGKWTMEEG